MMKVNKSRPRGCSVIAAVCVVLILMGAASAFGQSKRGADVFVEEHFGSHSTGELVAVKPGSILLLDGTGKDISVSLADIHSVRVIRKSKVAQGLFLGVLAGGATGYATGAISAKASGACPSCEAPLIRFGYGFLGATLGLVVGGIVGANAVSDLDIALDVAPGPKRDAALRKLGKYARVKNFR